MLYVERFTFYRKIRDAQKRDIMIFIVFGICPSSIIGEVQHTHKDHPSLRDNTLFDAPFKDTVIC